METPLELEFKHMTASVALEGIISGRVAKLERLHDRITACRVSVEASHQQHHHGKQFQVHVRLVVPGAVLVSSHDAGKTAHEDANVAVRDAFDAIQRQLEDHIRVHRGDVKAHSLPQA
jgi:ribosome-associated translation inhibitor RaiA